MAVVAATSVGALHASANASTTTTATTTTTSGQATATGSATSSATGSATTLLVLGDSLSWGANYFGKAQTRLVESATFTNIVFDARGSRRIGGITSTTFSGVNTYKALRAKGIEPSAVIVALGTNDIYFTQRKRVYVTLIRELMDALGPVPVVWMNVHRVESPAMISRSRVFNNTLEQVLAQYPLASTYDWATTARTTRSVMAFDKIHLSPSGYVARTQAMLGIAATLAAQVVELTTPTTTTTTPSSTTSPVPESTTSSVPSSTP